MRPITPLDLRRSLGRILDEASTGQRFLIERDHRPIAALVSVEDATSLDEGPDERRKRRRRALDRLAALGDRMLEAHPEGPDAVTALRLERRRDDSIDG